MEKAVILQTEFKDVESYKSQWEKLKANNPGLQKILQEIEKPGTALVFSHDDPDGITSGLIFKRVLQKKGWKVNLKMPEGFLLQPDQLEAAMKETTGAKAIFLLDKGTLVPYNNFADKLPVYIVDHHPTPAAPEKCTYFNPSLPAYTWCSTSILAHGIAALAGVREDFDDFLCMMGLKGDWAIEPVKGILADFAKPFFVEYGQNFKNLLTLVKERPTMFDAEQRDHTCLLSRVTEYVHATGGGGFSYFYNDREPALKNVNHAECIATALEGIADKMNEVKKIASLDDFVNLLPQPQQGNLKKIFAYFLQDWESANRILDSSARILKLDETSIYLFVGPKVPLLPMIGSIKLFELKQKPATSLLRSSWSVRSAMITRMYRCVVQAIAFIQASSAASCRIQCRSAMPITKTKSAAAVTRKRLNALSRPTRSLSATFSPELPKCSAKCSCMTALLPPANSMTPRRPAPTSSVSSI